MNCENCNQETTGCIRDHDRWICFECALKPTKLIEALRYIAGAPTLHMARSTALEALEELKDE